MIISSSEREPPRKRRILFRDGAYFMRAEVQAKYDRTPTGIFLTSPTPYSTLDVTWAAMKAVGL